MMENIVMIKYFNWNSFKFFIWFSDKRSTFDAIEKVECDRLLKDMTTLLRMVKQMDIMFSTVLTSYYAIQVT